MTQLLPTLCVCPCCHHSRAKPPSRMDEGVAIRSLDTVLTPVTSAATPTHHAHKALHTPCARETPATVALKF